MHAHTHTLSLSLSLTGMHVQAYMCVCVYLCVFRENERKFLIFPDFRIPRISFLNLYATRIFMHPDFFPIIFILRGINFP